MNTGRPWQWVACFLLGMLLYRLWPAESNKNARAQDVRVAKPSIGVGLVDLARLYKGDPEFAVRSEKLRAALQESDPGKTTSFQKLKDLRERFEPAEAQIYVATYERIIQASREVCRERGLQLVIRHTAGPLPAPEDRKGIEQLLARPVIFQDDLDITDDVLKRLKASATRE
jgi:hypothetical protein